ncbi:matrixin family metalloprotease [Candidatus Nitrosotenuis aquarius]|uniref:matrixin family metalloprotease n=1 Tax=Candidatus Nitrosotenuis aquarius TaxID=1846278 RepID=UPI000C1F8FD7|nr:M57 family metalloprotease [Candidatus Nitrosotenuis aquarius]
MSEKSLARLKDHLDLMKKELDSTTSQIKQIETKNKTERKSMQKIDEPAIRSLKNQEADLIQEISKIQKEIKKSRSKILLIAELAVLPAMFLILLMSGVTDTIFSNFESKETPNVLRTKYFTENLRGDTIDTWKSWRLVDNTLSINILKSPRVTEHQLEVIKNAIISEKTEEFDDSLVHKGPKGTKSMYYVGWAGALKEAAKEETKYNIPTNFEFVGSNGGEGDIIITLSNIKDSDGYTGYTKSITEDTEILKSFITIYDISNLSDDQLETIVRHEFGHALGLGHSTATEDLMAPTIDMTIPYITDCNIDAIVNLYNAKSDSQTVCEK